MVAQLAHRWQAEGTVIHWYDCPNVHAAYPSNACVNEIVIDLWSNYLPRNEALKLASGTVNYQNMAGEDLKYLPDSPTIYILDNAGFLHRDSLHYLCNILKYLYSHRLLNQIGFIFISNKKIQYRCIPVQTEVSATVWESGEIKQLLASELPDGSYHHDDTYLNQLMYSSAGHPLLALALAHKYHTTEQLILKTLIN